MKYLIRHAVTEEIWEYEFPDDGPQMIADLIAWIPELEPSRVYPTGYVGEYLEIRAFKSE